MSHLTLHLHAEFFLVLLRFKVADGLFVVRIKVNVTRLTFETLGDFPANAVNISVVAVNTAAAYLVWRIRLFVRYAPLCTKIKKLALKIPDILL